MKTNSTGAAENPTDPLEIELRRQKNALRVYRESRKKLPEHVKLLLRKVPSPPNTSRSYRDQIFVWLRDTHIQHGSIKKPELRDEFALVIQANLIVNLIYGLKKSFGKYMLTTRAKDGQGAAEEAAWTEMVVQIDKLPMLSIAGLKAMELCAFDSAHRKEAWNRLKGVQGNRKGVTKHPPDVVIEYYERLRSEKVLDKEAACRTANKYKISKATVYNYRRMQTQQQPPPITCNFCGQTKRADATNFPVEKGVFNPKCYECIERDYNAPPPLPK